MVSAHIIGVADCCTGNSYPPFVLHCFLWSSPHRFPETSRIDIVKAGGRGGRHHGAKVSSEVGKVHKHEQELRTHHWWSVLMNNQVMMVLILLLLLLLLQGSGSQISHGHHPVNSTRDHSNESSRIPA